MGNMGKEHPVLSDEDVQRRLSAELPRWSLAGGCLERVYRTSGWRASLMVANTIGHLAEAAWHHPEMHLSYYATTVRLKTVKRPSASPRAISPWPKIEDVVFCGGQDDSPCAASPNTNPSKYLITAIRRLN